MAIYSLLLKDVSTFDPDEIRRMTTAYEAALKLLQLQDRGDPVTELIAKKIIEVTRSGESDTAQMCARSLKELGIPLPK